MGDEPGAVDAPTKRNDVAPTTPDKSEPSKMPALASARRAGAPRKARLAMKRATVKPIPATIDTPYSFD
jgi:hypothetical protein